MIMDIEKSKEFLRNVCNENFKDKTFNFYIEKNLAGDYAVEIAEYIQTLRAKVASAEVLVEALESLVDNFKTMENGFNKTLFDKARKALATYDKLSEVKE